MFRPNSIGTLAKRVGRDIHSRPTYGPAAECPFAPVNLSLSTEKTTVRADSSASRGAAEETISPHGKILVPQTVSIAAGDRFSFAGENYLVVAIHPRHAVTGALDHFECAISVLPQ